MNMNNFNVGNLSGLIALFNAAHDHLKYPKIRLIAPSGQVVVLSVAGSKSQYPGTILVVDEGRYPDNKYFGRLFPDGRWQQGRAATQEVLDLVARLARDPAKVASEYGRLTGNCCFCRKALSDERSTAVGYGGTCAKHFDLPWGSVIYTQAA